MKIPKIDIFPGREDDALIIALAAGALLYIGTGVNAWAEEKWARAGGGVGSGAALLKIGKTAGRKDGFEDGYWTENPKLRRGGDGAAGFGAAVAGGVASAAANRAIDAAAERFFSTPEPPPAPLPVAPLPAPAPKPEPAASHPLPDGWWLDGKGRYRDKNNRIANDRRRVATLKRQRKG